MFGLNVLGLRNVNGRFTLPKPKGFCYKARGEKW